MSEPPFVPLQTRNGQDWGPEAQAKVAQDIAAANEDITGLMHIYDRAVDVYGDTPEGAFLMLATSLALSTYDPQRMARALARLMMIRYQTLHEEGEQSDSPQ